MITSLPSIAILIDCWESPKYNLPLIQCYNNINNFLNNTDSIETIVLASYDCRSEFDMDQYIWYQNNNKMCYNAIRKKIMHLKEADIHFYRYNNKYPEQKTHPMILNYLNPNKHQISMHWWWELEYYLLLHSEIKNIYFFGQAWEECLRIRPLGYESVLEERPDINILTNTQCVMRLDHSLPQLDLSNDPDWSRVDGNTYLYQPAIRL